jgi:hypothetical protein
MSQEMIDRLNELLECERAGVEAAQGLAASDAPGFSHGELQKFAEDEGWACGGLRSAILRCGGRPSERTGPFARNVLALAAEGERGRRIWGAAAADRTVRWRSEVDCTGNTTQDGSTVTCY